MRDIRRSLAELQAIGAIRIVEVRNLRKDLAAKASTSAAKGGSGRSDRGSAYAFEPPAQWERNSTMGARNPHKYGGAAPPITTSVTRTCWRTEILHLHWSLILNQ